MTDRDSAERCSGGRHQREWGFLLGGSKYGGGEGAEGKKMSAKDGIPRKKHIMDVCRWRSDVEYPMLVKVLGQAGAHGAPVLPRSFSEGFCMTKCMKKRMNHHLDDKMDHTPQQLFQGNMSEYSTMPCQFAGCLEPEAGCWLSASRTPEKDHLTESMMEDELMIEKSRYRGKPHTYDRGNYATTVSPFFGFAWAYRSWDSEGKERLRGRLPSNLEADRPDVHRRYVRMLDIRVVYNLRDLLCVVIRDCAWIPQCDHRRIAAPAELFAIWIAGLSMHPDGRLPKCDVTYSLLKDLAHVPSASAVDRSCRMDSYAVAWQESTVYALRTRSRLLDEGFADLKYHVRLRGPMNIQE
ncbi:hypothetical protein BJ912DRAFT_927445 [Pholiota molesta]|nr:hypothetical protein BJ912DRAFT_927445 [Pholiota molesta]